jgi:hypothetical protein
MVVHVLGSCLAAQDVWGSGSMIFQKCFQWRPDYAIYGILFGSAED